MHVPGSSMDSIDKPVTDQNSTEVTQARLQVDTVLY